MDKAKTEMLDDAVLKIVEAIADIISGEKKVVIKTRPSVADGATGSIISFGRTEIEVTHWVDEQ